MTFFLPMIPPTTTAQMRRVSMVGGKPRFYDSPAVASAKAKLAAALAKHRPDEPLAGPLRLVCKWCFPYRRGITTPTYKDTRPDTDNLQKALKDAMTDLGFWLDDAQVASEFVEKFWAEPCGIYVEIGRLTT